MSKITIDREVLEPVRCPKAIIDAIVEYGDARADQEAHDAPTTSNLRLADCIRAIREALAQPQQKPVTIHQVWLDRGWHDIPLDNVWRYSQDDWWDTRVVYTYPPTRNPLMDNLPSPDEIEALSDGNDGMLLDLGFVQKLNALANWMRKTTLSKPPTE